MGNRRHKTQEEAEPEKLSEPQVQSGPISQVKGDPEAQRLGLPGQVMQSRESRFRGRNNWS